MVDQRPAARGVPGRDHPPDDQQHLPQAAAKGDPVTWLRTAEEYFHSRGVIPVASACRALMRGAGVSVAQRRRGVADIPRALRATGLTVREYEVFQLVALRLGNREIAARLHLSPRTVEKHVASLLRKTGRPNRVALSELGAATLGN